MIPGSEAAHKWAGIEETTPALVRVDIDMKHGIMDIQD
jgi:hypothetical protein